MDVELMDMMELLERSSHIPHDATVRFKNCLNDLQTIHSNQSRNEHQTVNFNHHQTDNCESNQNEMNTAQVTPITLTTAATYQLSNLISQNPLLKSFIFGSFSGTCSTLLFQPFDLLKTRQQSPQLKSQNFLRLSWNIIKDERPIGLWRGTVPSLIRSVPGIGLYFCTLNGLERTFCAQENGQRTRPNALQAALFGLTARCSVGVLLMPATVIKTRLESGLFDYQNVKRAFFTIRQLEGIRGLWCGVAATMMRDAPFSGIYYMFYSQLQKVTSANNANKSEASTLISRSAMNFVCGLVSGFLASIVTQPPDVIKTHMQLRPDQYTSIRFTTLAIVNQYGFSGLFRGLAARMIRRTLMSSLAWTVYEAFAQNYNLK